jgi:hypothetical protein
MLAASRLEPQDVIEVLRNSFHLAAAG